MPGDPAACAAVRPVLLGRHLRARPPGVADGRRPGCRAHFARPRPSCTRWPPKCPGRVDRGGRGNLAGVSSRPVVLFSGNAPRSRLTIVAHPGASVFASTPSAQAPKAARPFEWFDSQMRLCAPDGTVVARDRYRLCGALMVDRIPGVTGTFQCMVLSLRSPARCRPGTSPRRSGTGFRGWEMRTSAPARCRAGAARGCTSSRTMPAAARGAAPRMVCCPHRPARHAACTETRSRTHRGPGPRYRRRGYPWTAILQTT